MSTNVLVFIERRDGEIKRPSLEALGVARRLADKSGGRVDAVAIGPGASGCLREVAAHGARDPQVHASVLRLVPDFDECGAVVEERSPPVHPVDHLFHAGRRPRREVLMEEAIKGKIKSALFGGEGLFYAILTGPGRIWLQSLPFSRLADRIYKAIPSLGKGGKGEGSVLGGIGIGNLLSGD